MDQAAIRDIRRQYAQINAGAAKCRRVKKELWGYSTEGGNLVAFFQGDTLVKLELIFLGESGRTAEEYYYQDGRLIFFYQANSRYDQPLSGKVVRTEESRGYFHDGGLIAWIDPGGKSLPRDRDRYRDQQKERLRYSEEFSQAARSPEPDIQAVHYR